MAESGESLYNFVVGYKLACDHIEYCITFPSSRHAHGSSEGHEMLKRNDKYQSIADDVPIPKM